eukprot:5146507-Amphidinium_carterae.1
MSTMIRTMTTMMIRIRIRRMMMLMMKMSGGIVLCVEMAREGIVWLHCRAQVLACLLLEQSCHWIRQILLLQLQLLAEWSTTRGT